MTKEEIIKEAYGNYYDSLKPYIGENGEIYQMRIIDNEDPDIIYENVICELNMIRNNAMLRPKSLQGIEDNNGWTKINSEDDLPEEDLQCWLIDEEFGMDIGYFSFQTKTWFCDEVKQFTTHYQKIIKPKPPLY